jgi:hypothetical protein
MVRSKVAYWSRRGTFSKSEISLSNLICSFGIPLSRHKATLEKSFAADSKCLASIVESATTNSDNNLSISFCLGLLTGLDTFLR